MVQNPAPAACTKGGRCPLTSMCRASTGKRPLSSPELSAQCCSPTGSIPVSRTSITAGRAYIRLGVQPAWKIRGKLCACSIRAPPPKSWPWTYCATTAASMSPAKPLNTISADCPRTVRPAPVGGVRAGRAADPRRVPAPAHFPVGHNSLHESLRSVVDPRPLETHLQVGPPASLATNVLSHSALPQSWMYSPSIPLCALGRHVHVDCALAKAAQDLGVHSAGK